MSLLPILWFIPAKAGNAGNLSIERKDVKKISTALTTCITLAADLVCCASGQYVWVRTAMSELINALRGLFEVLSKVGPMGVAVLALLVALAAILIPGGR